MNIRGNEFNGTIGNTINTIKMGSTLVSTGRFPIESWKVWYNVRDAKAYVADSTASATAYPGMILAIVPKESSYYSNQVEYNETVAAKGVYLVTDVGLNATKTNLIPKVDASDNESDSDSELEDSDYIHETEFVGWIKLGSEINSDIQSAIESLESSIGDVEDKVDTIDFAYDSVNDRFTFTNGDGETANVNYPKVSISVEDNPEEAPNVSKRYSFTHVENGVGNVTTIDIPKDSSLVSVKYINQDESESDYDSDNTGCLEFVYTLADGTEETVYVDISETITDAELDAYIQNMLVDSANGISDLNADKIPTVGAVKSYVNNAVANIIGENGIAAETIHMGDAANDGFVATTNVGFIDAGTTIPYDKTVYDILKDILCKELIPAAGDRTLPKITNAVVSHDGTIITGGSNIAVEIGTEFDTTTPITTVTATYTDGKLKTYGSGNYTMTEINANCSVNGDPYIDSISGAGVNGNKVREGAISFTVKQDYSSSQVFALSSSGNQATANQISAGTASTTATSRGAYKIWSGTVTNATANTWLNNTNYNLFKSATGITEGWTNPAASGTVLNGGTITHDNAHAFVLVCPGTYRLYATQLNTLVEGTVNQSFYTHTLPDNTTVSYTLYVLWGQGVEYKDLSCRKI